MTSHHEPKSFLDINEPHKLADSFRSRHVHFKGLFASLSKDATETRRDAVEKTKEVAEREAKIFSRAIQCVEKFGWPLPYHPYVKDNNMDAAQYFTQIPIPQGGDSYSSTPNLMSPHPSQIISVSQASPNRDSPSQSVRANFREKSSHMRSSSNRPDSRRKMENPQTKEDVDLVIAGLMEAIAKIKSIPKFTEFSIPTAKVDKTLIKTEPRKTTQSNEREEGEASDDDIYAKRDSKDGEEVEVASKHNGHTDDVKKTPDSIESNDKVEDIKSEKPKSRSKRLLEEVDSESDAANKRPKTSGKRGPSTKQSDSSTISSFEKPRSVPKSKPVSLPEDKYSTSKSLVVELKYPDKGNSAKRDTAPKRKNRGSYSSSDESDVDSEKDGKSRRSKPSKDLKYDEERKSSRKEKTGRNQLVESDRNTDNEVKRSKLSVKSKASSRKSQYTDSELDSDVDVRPKKNSKPRKSVEQYPDDSEINTDLNLKIKAAKAARRSQNEESDLDPEIGLKIKKLKSSKANTAAKSNRHCDSDIESDIDFRIKKIKANRSGRKVDADSDYELQRRRRPSADPSSKKIKSEYSVDDDLSATTKSDSKPKRSVSSRSPRATKPLKRSSSTASYSDESEVEKTGVFAIPDVEKRSNTSKGNGRPNMKDVVDDYSDQKPGSRRSRDAAIDGPSDSIKSKPTQSSNTRRTKDNDTSESFSEPSKIKPAAPARRSKEVDLDHPSESSKLKLSRRPKETDVPESPSRDRVSRSSASRKSKEDDSEDERLSHRSSTRKSRRDSPPARDRRIERNELSKSKQSSEAASSPIRNNKDDKKRLKPEDVSSRERSRLSVGSQNRKSREDGDSNSRNRNLTLSKDRSRSRSVERRETDLQERERSSSMDKRADRLDRSSSTFSEKSSLRDRQGNRESRTQRRPSPSRSRSPVRRSRDHSRDSRLSDRYEKNSQVDNSSTHLKPNDEKYSSSKPASVADKKASGVRSRGGRDNNEPDDRRSNRSKDESRDNTDIEDRRSNRPKDEADDQHAKSRPNLSESQIVENKTRESELSIPKKTMSLADYRKQKPGAKSSHPANPKDDSSKEVNSENDSSKLSKSTELSPESVKSSGSGAPTLFSVNTPTPQQKTPSRDNVYTPMRELGSSAYKPTTAEIEYHRIEYVRYNNLARDYKRKAVENAESGNSKRVKESTPQFLASLYAFIRSIACFQVSRHGSYKECISHWESLDEFMAYTRRKLRIENYTDLNALCAKIDALINLRIVRLRQAYCNDILMSKNLRKLSTNKEEQIRLKVFNDVANQCGRQKDTMDRVHRKWTEGEQIFTIERLEARFPITYRKCHGPEKTLKWPLLQDPNFDDLLKFADSVFDEYLEKHNITFEALPFEVNEYDPENYKNKDEKEKEAS